MILSVQTLFYKYISNFRQVILQVQIYLQHVLSSTKFRALEFRFVTSYQKFRYMLIHLYIFYEKIVPEFSYIPYLFYILLTLI